MIIRAVEESDIKLMEQLMQLYLYDFSAFSDQPMDSDGQFLYPYLSHYWHEPDRHAFLIEQEMGNKKNVDPTSEVVGFALVRKISDPNDGKIYHELAEFFILRRYRKSGLGKQAAAALWSMLPGAWQLSVLDVNKGGIQFWQSVLEEEEAVGSGYKSFKEKNLITYRFTSH